jgi:hypothetical protein
MATRRSSRSCSFRRMIGGNIADLRRVGKGGSGLVTRTPDRLPLVAHSPIHFPSLLRRKSKTPMPRRAPFFLSAAATKSQRIG